MIESTLTTIASVNAHPDMSGTILKGVISSDIDDEWSQAYLEIWQMIASSLKFKLDIQEVESQLPEATWDVMLTKIQTSSAQMALSPVLMLPSTASNVSFSVPVHRTSLSVLIRGSASEGVRWSSYFEPFRKSLWQALLATVIVLTIILATFWCSEHTDSSAPHIPVDVQIGEAFICILGASCSQGHPHPPRSTSARIVHLIALISAVIVLAVYSSSVTAFLAVSRDLRPFSSLDQLLSSSKFRPFTLAGSPEHAFFEESNHEKMMKYRWTSGPPTTLSSMSEALSVTCGRNTSLLGTWSRRVPAFVISSLWADRALAAAPCILQHIALTNNQPLWAAFPLSQKLTNIKLINRKLEAMIAAGAIIRYSNQISLRAELNRERRLAEGNSVRDPRFIVAIKDVAPLLALLGCGTALAALLLTAEYLLRRFNRFKCKTF